MFFFFFNPRGSCFYLSVATSPMWRFEYTYFLTFTFSFPHLFFLPQPLSICSFFSCETNFSHPSVQTHTSWQTTLYPHCLVLCSTLLYQPPLHPDTWLRRSENRPAPNSREALTWRWQRGLKTKPPPLKPSRRGCHVLWPGVLIRDVICCHIFKVISL